MHALAQDPLQTATERSQRYWTSDGIPLTVMGGCWLVWGVVLLVPILFPHRQIINLMSIVLLCTMAFSGLLMKLLIRGWKERVSFPRTGYIELRHPRKTVRYAIIAIVFLVSFTIALVARDQERNYRELVALGLGLVLAGGMLYAAWKMHSTRLALFSSIIVGVAIYSSAAHLQAKLTYALFLLAAGLACVADGLLTYRSYLRAHPTPAGDAQ